MRSLSQRYAADIMPAAIGTNSTTLLAIAAVLTLIAAMPLRIFLFARSKRARRVSVAVLALLTTVTVVGMISTTALSVLALAVLAILAALLINSAPKVLQIMHGSDRPY